MEKRARVTIKDVAKKAEVTPQTVSRAFRDTHDISEETKNRILKIAAELGYVKNSSATSLRSGSSHLIAVFYDNLMNCYFSIMTEFLQECLKERGYSMMAFSIRNSHLTGEAYLSAVAHSVDGIISFLEPKEEISDLIAKYHVPVLLFGRRTKVPRIDYVRSDDETGGRLAAEKLIAAGCKRPVFIGESMELTCVLDRFHGFEEAFGEHGIQPRTILNTLGQSLCVEPNLKALCEDKETAPDGVFCFNDMIAFETLYVLDKNDLPAMKVIGFDNIQQEIYLPRRLTTIGVDKRSMAKRAVELLVSRIEEGGVGYAHAKENVFLVEGTTV